MKPILAFCNVTMVHAEKTVLHDFSLQLEQGQAIGLIGPSGVGKSTLLRLAAGLVRPTDGIVHCSAKRLGYVFQEPRLLPWKTVLDNVALPLIARGIRRTEAHARSLDSLRDMHLEQHADSYPSTLSGGMKQRVSLARAFAIRPDMLLFDEPFTGLDPILRNQLRDITDHMLENRNVALLHVTHDTRELAQATSRIVQLEGISATAWQHPVPADNA